LLAAGLSSRMGNVNKLLQPVSTTVEQHASPSLVVAVAQMLLASSVDEIVVVTGHQHTQIKKALDGLALRFLNNPDFADGMASSVASGVRALADMDAVVVALGDMPLVSSRVIETLVAAFDQQPGLDYFVPTYAGRVGNPVLFAQSVYPAVIALQGDVGARSLWSKPTARTQRVKVNCPGVLRDFDTTDALSDLQKRAPFKPH